ncbi:uncharacterized protein F54H12.2-like [Mercenaria mercenaria]|uniref:uncharacterized protein F54H12.2-like n=1 Tax=Mercenaria mercenaria TaxID=6596 RepID=UPI00234FABE6|nr:uncharacterized protein F54H12.2-like [Mercenaria mercenaria]
MMQHGSCECSKTELHVSAVPPTMSAMQDGQWTKHYPISALNNSAPIEFIIPPQTEKWTDLNQSYLYIKFKVTKADGTDLEAGTETSVVNNFFHSTFSSIDLYLNNKLISSNTHTYPYRAYIENLLSYNKECKNTQLRAFELWDKDTSGHMQANTRAGANSGWKVRRTRIAESKSCELIGRLHLDLFLQEKYLPNGIKIRLKLNRASPNFCLMGTAEGKVDIQQAGFNVRTVELLPVVANDLNQAISQHNMKIPIRRVVVKTFTIPDGQRSKIDDHLFLGQLPKRLIIGMVRNADMNGDPATNPFDFRHFHLSKLEVSIDGKTIRNKAFQPNFENGECMRSYMSLYQATGALGLNRSIGLTMTEYKSGYTLWGFYLTADQGCEEGQLHPIKTGNLRIDLQFAQQLPSVVNVTVYAEFDNQIEINGLRKVVTDY